MLQVLVADDDDDVRGSVASALSDAGHEVTEARDGAQALELVSSHVFDLAICDVQMPKLDGMTLFRRIRREAPGTAIVIMTSFGKIPDAIGSLREGAIDYVTKPFDPDEFAHKVVGPIAERRSLRRKFDEARDEFVARAAGTGLVALSPAMRRLSERIALLSSSEAPVVITGDAGAGKGLVARTVHARGCRREGPFLHLDGALLTELISASGRNDGSGAAARRGAWFHDLSGGTLVLGGIERVPLGAQAHLLDLIEEPGAQARTAPDWQPRGVRLITVAREGLTGLAADGLLLESLYYRLNGVQLRVPPLKERGPDLCALVTQLLEELARPGGTSPVLTPGAWNALASYPFPGNVRELRQVLSHALALAGGEPIDVAHLPPELLGSSG